MPITNQQTEKVTLPLRVFETADTKEDLEDWLLAQNAEFIKQSAESKAR